MENDLNKKFLEGRKKRILKSFGLLILLSFPWYMEFIIPINRKDGISNFFTIVGLILPIWILIVVLYIIFVFRKK